MKNRLFFAAFLAFISTALIVLPTKANPMGNMGLDWIQDQCPIPDNPPPCMQTNPFCVAAHRSMRGTVDQAIAMLGGPAAPNLQDQPNLNQNCGPGLIVELAAHLYMRLTNQRVYLLSKTYGKACNGHSEDVIVFPDGCAFDVIGGAGGPQQRETMQAICCGDPPDQTDGGCLPVFGPRFMDPPNWTLP